MNRGGGGYETGASLAEGPYGGLQRGGLLRGSSEDIQNKSPDSPHRGRGVSKWMTLNLLLSVVCKVHCIRCSDYQVQISNPLYSVFRATMNVENIAFKTSLRIVGYNMIDSLYRFSTIT